PDLVLPGHPRHDRSPQSPRVSPARWRSILDQGIRQMQEQVGRCEVDGANFLDGKPKQILPGLHYLGDFGGQAVYCLQVAGRLFLFDAPGGSGLVQFLEERLPPARLAPRQPTAVLLTSCDPEATTGLGALAAQSGCQVFAARAGLSSVRTACPAGTAVRDATELATTGWFPVRVVPLQGRGLAPLAYEITWQGETIGVSGRIPQRINR